jgi:GDPmannose 4,6-dehydratase
MLQLDTPDDFVVASGESHTVREFCELAFRELGLDYRDYVRVDERFYRPLEVEALIGDATKAHTVLGWKPTYTFSELVSEMVQSDLKTTLGQPEAVDAR